MSAWWEVKGMNKLLSAEFMRLYKSFVFKLCLIFSAGLGIFTVIIRWLDIRKHADTYAQLSVEYRNADGLIFVGSLYMIFAVAVFVSIFVGTEYSDGTIRNKLTIGHKRSKIYFSKLIVCAAVTFTINILYIVVVLLFGNILIGGTTMSIVKILSFTATCSTAIIALTAILLLLSMSIQNKAAGAVTCLIVTLVMMFAALIIYQRLNTPEYYDAYSFVNEDTGKTISVDKEKNTKYLSGTKREVYEFMNDFLPVSQLYQVAMNVSDNLMLIIIYDCIIIIASTGIGVTIFKKKDLK